jgi:hypothetical protein
MRRLLKIRDFLLERDPVTNLWIKEHLEADKATLCQPSQELKAMYLLLQ